ncbi:glycosyl hydrolase [Paenibacillus sp. J23TS9]|uniref:alpha-mannosidase n=1 Tax=Paenibacillus sp. J23TS9 TaxID=2807193 RepID=UPI001B0C7863|nr:alpha-mannosidase [Paenibacillus sp. J23TS9]GIP27555.1 glycosyl hydrolase [Paenibacillus sp. J23TS9]
MTQSKTVHIISHTHWDREWYLPYEKHHVRLIKLMDTLLTTLHDDPDFKSFHLDGQTIMLDDYLQIRPEKRPLLEEYVREGRIHIGPWYILQDEFLTSSEANVRNLLYGHQDAERFGAVSKTGYFPDSFGNMGQAPQLLRQAGIGNAVFGRGVKPTGFNNEVSESAAYESPYSEMIWEAPDGSHVLGILFANWYSNGNEIPVDPKQAQKYWERKLKEVDTYASTPHVLMMNGCDHQPVQQNISEAIKVAQRLLPEHRFVHSNFTDYIEAAAASVPDHLSTVRGELRSQHTDGWSTLVNTASSRIYLKQLNSQGQALLEQAAEPLAVFAHLTGKAPYPHHLFEYAWKTLMQNHPHDSICGCSVDEVHDEMVTRFAKSRHVGEAIVEDSVAAITDDIDTRSFADFLREGENGYPLAVFNTTGWKRSGVITVELELERICFGSGMGFADMKKKLRLLPLEHLVLLDPGGSEIPFSWEDQGVGFGYDLPEDRFRQPFFTRRIQVRFEAEDVPALGYKVYALIQGKQENSSQESGVDVSGGSSTNKLIQKQQSSLVTGKRSMENEFLAVTIEANGSVTLQDKGTGRIFRNLCIYEDSGDIGNEYMYKQPDGDVPVTTRNSIASITLAEDEAFRASFDIMHTMRIPKSADDNLSREQKELIWFTGRKASRSSSLMDLHVHTRITLERSGRGLQVKTTFHNEADDHRLRILFESGISSQSHKADSIFETAERNNKPAAEWLNPSNCQHQQAFVSIRDERQGLTIANQGLPEYEIIQEDAAVIAVTLLRAVGEMGDWGYFPTPGAQCHGKHTTRLEIIPFDPAAAEQGSIHMGETGSMIQARQFQVPWTVKQADVHTGSIPLIHSFLSWTGKDLFFSALKMSKDTGSIIARWYNAAHSERSLSAQPAFEIKEARHSNILENALDMTVLNGVAVRPAEIVTFSLHLPD